MQHEFRTNLNLLPKSYRRWVLVRSALTLWAVVWTVGLSAASALLWRADSKVEALRDEVSRYERSYAPFEVLAAEVDEMRTRLVEIEDEEVAAAVLEDNRPVLSLLGIISRAAKGCSDRLQVRECRLKRSADDRHPFDELRPGAQQQALTLRGQALDLLQITKFHAALRDAGMFDHVDLISTSQEPIGDTHGHTFHIECVY